MRSPTSVQFHVTLRLTPPMLRRPRTLLLTALALSAASLPAQSRGLSDADLLRLQTVGGVAIAPTGDRVLYTITGWEHPNAKADTVLGDKHDRRSHVWIVPFAGGTPRQLTFGERGESQPAWSPDGRTIAFVSARGAGTGDDAPKPQVWLLPADGGEAKQVTTIRPSQRAKTSCSSTPFFMPLTVTKTRTTSCIVAGMLLRMMSFSNSWSAASARSSSRNFIRLRWPG